MAVYRKMEVMVKFENVSKKFTRDGTTFEALSNISLNIEDNAITGIVGRSGAGKSSILRLINLLDKPDSGRIIIDDLNIQSNNDYRELRRSIGFVFQHFNLVKNLSVYDNIAIPLKLLSYTPDRTQKRVQELLEKVELSGYEARYPGELSGGQRQRIAIARALATEPKMLLFDEATSALDPETTQKMIKLIKKLQQELKLTVIFVSHEMDFVKKLADTIILIDKGHIIEKARKLDFFIKPQSNLAKEYVFSNLNKNLFFDYHETQQSPDDDMVMRLSFNHESTHEPIMSSLTHEKNVRFNIIAAEIEHIDDRQIGHMMITIPSRDRTICLDYLAFKKISCEVLGYV